MMRKSQICLIMVLLSLPALFAYDRKPLPQPAPDACPGWQESQGVFIGAAAYVGERTRELYDLKELGRFGLVAVLVSAKNTNSFPVIVYEGGMKVLDAGAKENPAVPWESVAGAILRPDADKGSTSTGLPPVDVIRTMSTKGRPAAILEDLRTKAFGTRTVKSGETVHGVVFFRLGTDPATVQDSRLYVGELANEDSGEELVFFEFDLKIPPPAPEKKK